MSTEDGRRLNMSWSPKRGAELAFNSEIKEESLVEARYLCCPAEEKRWARLYAGTVQGDETRKISGSERGLLQTASALKREGWDTIVCKQLRRRKGI